MDRKTIDKLPNNPTKSQEIEFLRQVQNSVPTNSYLGSLLTDEFLAWVRANILADFTSNIMEVVGKYAGNLQNVFNDLNELKSKVERLEREKAGLEFKLKASAERESDLRRTLDGLVCGVQVDIETRLNDARNALRKL